MPRSGRSWPPSGRAGERPDQPRRCRFRALAASSLRAPMRCPKPKGRRHAAAHPPARTGTSARAASLALAGGLRRTAEAAGGGAVVRACRRPDRALAEGGCGLPGRLFRVGLSAPAGGDRLARGEAGARRTGPGQPGPAVLRMAWRRHRPLPDRGAAARRRAGRAGPRSRRRPAQRRGRRAAFRARRVRPRRGTALQPVRAPARLAIVEARSARSTS